MTDRLWACPAAELAALYAAGEASPVEALGACLDRAAEIGDSLNAIVARNDEAAFRDARASEARWAAGPQRSPLDGDF
jgi:aspartyl-tRNA(Asn)/glutamyl-tRNA(Gln) amidotransferase subunit A